VCVVGLCCVSINLEISQFCSVMEKLQDKKNPLSQHDEMCLVVVSAIFFQMSQLLYVTVSFANITFMR
jgi:hypothetical protein